MKRSVTPLKFLLVDNNADVRTLLAKALLRTFPDCVVQECQNADTALSLAASDRLTAAVAHRTSEYDGETLVRLLRRTAAELPIIMISAADKRERAREAGADAFVSYEAWLTIDDAVAEAVVARECAVAC